jgi:hypothetical protein
MNATACDRHDTGWRAASAGVRPIRLRAGIAGDGGFREPPARSSKRSRHDHRRAGPTATGRLETVGSSPAAGLVDRGDVTAEVLRLLLEVDDHESPIRALVEHCLTHGTSEACGRQPWMSASVGARLEPFMLQAITCLVDEQILVEED